jgi:hypothetical protein
MFITRIIGALALSQGKEICFKAGIKQKNLSPLTHLLRNFSVKILSVVTGAKL